MEKLVDKHLQQQLNPLQQVAFKDAFAQLQGAEKALQLLGCCIHRHVARYSQDGDGYWASTRISTPYDVHTHMHDHSYADAIRDLSLHAQRGTRREG